MVENINDLISIAFLALLLLVCFHYAFSIFAKHHAHRVRQLEEEYYDVDDDEDDESSYY